MSLSYVREKDVHTYRTSLIKSYENCFYNLLTLYLQTRKVQTKGILLTGKKNETTHAKQNYSSLNCSNVFELHSLLNMLIHVQLPVSCFAVQNLLFCWGCFVVLQKPFLLCSSRKNPYPPQGRSSEIPKGRGVLKAKNFRSKV